LISLHVSRLPREVDEKVVLGRGFRVVVRAAHLDSAYSVPSAPSRRSEGSGHGRNGSGRVVEHEETAGLEVVVQPAQRLEVLFPRFPSVCESRKG
jgi:hypothetical protein